MALKDEIEEEKGAERPPSAVWMFVSVPVLAVAIVVLFGLTFTGALWGIGAALAIATSSVLAMCNCWHVNKSAPALSA